MSIGPPIEVYNRKRKRDKGIMEKGNSVTDEMKELTEWTNVKKELG
jgi:hypothetical protein